MKGGFLGSVLHTYPSVVAMFGWIMPEPLATPNSRIGRAAPGKVSSPWATLVTVSVVRIALANPRGSADSDSPTVGIAAAILPTSSGTPITPVEQVKTASVGHSSGVAAASAR